MLGPVCQVLCGNASHQRISRVAVGEQGADGKQHLGDGECRAPVVFQDVQTDDTLAVDVAVVNPCTESHLGGFKGVLRGEGDVQKEDAPLVHRAWRPQDGGPPLVDVVSLWASTAVGRGVQCYLRKLLLNPLGAGRQLGSCFARDLGLFLLGLGGLGLWWGGVQLVSVRAAAAGAGAVRAARLAPTRHGC